MINISRYKFLTTQNNEFLITNAFNSQSGEGKIFAENNFEMVGQIQYNFFKNNSIYMASILVKKEFRNCGIGSALIYCLEDFAIKNNVEVIHAYMNNMVYSAETLKEVKARERFYDSLNFTASPETSQICSLIKTRDKFLEYKNNVNPLVVSIKNPAKK